MQKEKSVKKIKNPFNIKWDGDTKKEAAKIGMTASLATVVGTSLFLKNKTMANLHIISGIALVGFSYWHNQLSIPKKKNEVIDKAL